MSDRPDHTLPVSIEAITIVSLPVDIVAQTIGNIGIDIAAQSVGNIAVNLAGSDITLNVNLSSQSVDININTSGGANIVIDKLTQGAYTERRAVLSNNGATGILTTSNLTNLRGKFFPRGCRGFLKEIECWTDNTDTSAHVLTIRLSPSPEAGVVITATKSLAGPTAAGWNTVAIRKFWNYDSLFIWIQSDSDTYGHLKYSNDEPFDYYTSTDGIDFTEGVRRYWFRADYTGLSVGDLPVSGTLNTVNLPSDSSSSDSDEVDVPVATETSILTVKGFGSTRRITIWVAHSDILIRFYVDGVLMDMGSFHSSTNFNATTLNFQNYGVSTPQIQLMHFTSDGSCRFNVTFPIHFRTSFEVRAYHDSGATRKVRVGLIADLLR